jgi:hypothetical protein
MATAPPPPGTQQQTDPAAPAGPRLRFCPESNDLLYPQEDKERKVRGRERLREWCFLEEEGKTDRPTAPTMPLLARCCACPPGGTTRRSTPPLARFRVIPRPPCLITPEECIPRSVSH